MVAIEFISNEIKSEYLNLCKEKLMLEKYPDRLTKEYYQVWGNADYLRYKWVSDRINYLESIYIFKE